MTLQKPRTPTTVAGACSIVLGAVQAEGCAAAIGKTTPSLIYKFVDPDSEREPRASQIVALDVAYRRAAGGRASPIVDVLRRLVDDATRDVAHDAQPPHARMLDVMGEVGEIAADLHKAMADGVLKPFERQRLLKDVADAQAKLDDLARDLAVPALSVKPA